MTFTYTIEDYLDILLGFHSQSSEFSIDPRDTKLLFSLHNQVNRKLGLTDRQFDLLKEKLKIYESQFLNNGYTELDFSTTRIPVRTIDRSQWIRITDDAGHKKISVRFSFNKKLISCLEELRRRKCEGVYYNETKIRTFDYSEINLFNVVDVFKNKGFEIEPQLLEQYETLLSMKENKKDYLPGIYNFKLKNLHQRAVDYIISDLGEPCQENLAFYKDRQELIGLKHFDQEDLDRSIFNLTSLSQKIVKRTKQQVFVNSEKYTLDHVIESVLELNRLPLLILISENHALDMLSECHSRFKNIVLDESISIMFRKDNVGEGVHFNQYIKDNNLNTTLNPNTKIAYIQDNKITKPLIKSNWEPKAVLCMSSSRFQSKVDSYINEKDLVIHFDNEVSYFLRDRIEEM